MTVSAIAGLQYTDMWQTDVNFGNEYTICLHFDFSLIGVRWPSLTGL